jgi:NADPH:quinone reductase-like Zn-dependent oxidoreductase
VNFRNDYRCSEIRLAVPKRFASSNRCKANFSGNTRRMKSMQVLVAPEYGNADVLRIEQQAVPQPGSQEVLVRVVATTVNRTDTAILSGQPFFARLVFGLRRPKRSVVGTEFSGIIESVGEAVTDMNAGDRVFGFHDEGASAHADYLVASQREALGKIPDGVATDKAAACSEGPFYAMNFLSKVSVSAGSRVLINGVSGSIGSAALQLLKQQGAFVVGVCPEAAFASVRALNVDELYGPDFSFNEDAEPFDLILDTVGPIPGVSSVPEK